MFPTARLIFALLMWAAFGIDFHISRRREGPPEQSGPTAFLPTFHPLTYLVFLGVLFLLNIFSFGIRDGLSLLILQCLPVWIHISLYYCLLLPLLPLLRRHFSAKACAVLWLLPNALYVINSVNSLAYPNTPWLVLPVPGTLEKWILPIWLTGFVIVFGWQLFSHFHLRRALLSQARQIRDPEVMELWMKAQNSIQMELPQHRLYRCGAVQTPMSIGLIKKTICVLLPDKSYTADELELIFRHELIHIKRKDSQCKLTLIFFTSLFWFNPFGILAKRRCSEDLELSCDESVLLGASQATREKYARLLLQTAGDDRGFSSCLSASAKSLLYRLTNTLHPGKRFPGAVAAGFLCALLIFSCGYITVSYAHSTGAESLFVNAEPDEYRLNHITLADSDTEYLCSDEEALVQYLSQLRLYRLVGDYHHEDTYWYRIMYDVPQGKIQISISEHKVDVFGFRNGELIDTTWFHEEQIDKDLLMGFLKKA